MLYFGYVPMKLKFNRDVRKSIAEELKKLSNFGGVGLGFMGYSNNSPTVLLAAFVWWILCQTIAHLLMSLEDGD
jgi:hypothetical protein